MIEVRNSSGSTWLAHFTYDGLGRLIRLQRPYPGYVNGRRIEHYYYDGSRRIQEIFHDPIADLSEEESTGGEGEIAEWVYTDYAAMEYVHSPFYVDELVCQFAVSDFTAPWFAVRDANYIVVGVVDEDGVVRRQRSFTPYGELLWEETFSAGSGPSTVPWVRAGHQGLFYDRLDGFYASTPITTISKGLNHNRNRSYSPHLGMFVQADPRCDSPIAL